MQLVGDAECPKVLEVAFWIQKTVLNRTGCRVSIGIGPNLVVAKLAGQRAKPSDPQFGHIGVYAVDRSNALDFMKSVKLSELPGVGDRYAFVCLTTRQTHTHSRVCSPSV